MASFSIIDYPKQAIPASPGVYIFKSSEGTPLYVGKSKKLKNRLASYFRPASSLPARTAVMVKKARFVEIFLTRTEKEALILEAELINRHKPRYNIRLRDDKAYPFLRLGVKSRFPRLSIVRKRRRDGALYFGPYTSSQALRQTLKTIFAVFRLRSCTDRAMKTRSRPCLKFQVRRCSGPCTGEISQEDYMAEVRKVKAFLEGRASFVVQELEDAMKDAAARLDFEKAARLRDQINALGSVVESQAVVIGAWKDMDVIYMETDGSMAQAVVLRVRKGIIVSRDFPCMDIGLEHEIDAVYRSFLKIYYSENTCPGQVILPLNLAERDGMEELLSHYSGMRVRISCQARGKARELLEMARLNARRGLRDRIARDGMWKDRARLIMETIGLGRLPHVVEGIDISNISGSLPVGSLVRFSAGQPDKSGYRHYFLRADGPDDYAMIQETMERRIRRGTEKDDLPDLFIIDGGQGQLNAALMAFRKLGKHGSCDIIALAKAGKDQGEKIFIPGRDRPLRLDRSNTALRFCQHVRDEAHRFGVKTHRSRRRRNMLDSELLKVPGIGHARRMLLLRHFGSAERVAEATLKDLEAVPGMPASVARNIASYFSSK